jgi:hypothetical protein
MFPAFSQQYRIPAAVKGYGEVNDAVKASLEKAYGPGRWVLAYFNQEIYLNHDLLADKKIHGGSYDVIKRRCSSSAVLSMS